MITEDIHKQDFIFITQTRWDGVPSTSYALALEFAKTNRVFFIDKPYTWKDLLTLKKNPGIKERLNTYFLGKKRFRNLTALPEKFIVVVSFLSLPINWLPAGRIYNFFLRKGQNRMERVLHELCVHYKVSNYILFNSYNPFYSFPRAMGIVPAVRIYQSVDNMAHTHYLSKHGTYLENNIIKEADLLLATSKEIIGKFNALGFGFHYLPNAAHVKIFKDAYFLSTQRPVELDTITKPIIGYIGSIDFRTDYKLLYSLAKQNPDKVIILIGPRSKVKNDEGIDTLPNILFLGFKSAHELPLYAKYFDCAIIPFEYNEFTRSIYPLKINEYLAAGRPVVTTRFSDDITLFDSIAYVADSKEEFLFLVTKALHENSKTRELERIAFADKNSWSARVSAFWEILKSQ